MIEKRDTHYSAKTYRLLKHFQHFCASLKLLDKPHALVGLSGGVDSVLMAYLLKTFQKELGLKKIRAIHINHGTRKSCHKEEEFVTNFCYELGIDLVVITINDLLIDSSNFENQARKARYKAFKDNLHMDENLLLAQHIDDSFEWSLMQKLKSSNVEATLGIPVVNGQIRRPFMSLTKNQILFLAKQLNLCWCEDESNKDLRFERNYIREFIKKSIAPKYPQYLKHYVKQSNSLAHKLEIHRITNDHNMQIFEREWGYIVKAQSLVGYEDDLASKVKELSNKGRGNIRGQLDKLVESHTQKRRGEFGFSGNVFATCIYPYVFIYGERPQLYPDASQITGRVPLFRSCKASKSLKSAVKPFLPESSRLLSDGQNFNFAWRVKGKVLFYI